MCLPTYAFRALYGYAWICTRLIVVWERLVAPSAASYLFVPSSNTCEVYLRTGAHVNLHLKLINGFHFIYKGFGRYIFWQIVYRLSSKPHTGKVQLEISLLVDTNTLINHETLRYKGCSGWRQHRPTKIPEGSPSEYFYTVHVRHTWMSCSLSSNSACMPIVGDQVLNNSCGVTRSVGFANFYTDKTGILFGCSTLTFDCRRHPSWSVRQEPATLFTYPQKLALGYSLRKRVTVVVVRPTTKLQR